MLFSFRASVHVWCYIIYYTILSSIFRSSSSSIPSQYSSPLLLLLFQYPIPTYLIHSILVGTNIYLFIFHSNILILSSYHIPLLIYLPSFPNTHSILVGTYIYLFIFHSNILILSSFPIIPILIFFQIRAELVFLSDCKVFDCISSKSEQNWCFVLVDGFELVDGV